MLLERVEEELAARKGVPVGVILVDPGADLEAMDVLLERIWSRIGEPVLLGEGNLFGVVVSGVDDGGVESAARRALAAASSLGARDTRAGAAIYPRDARSAEDLLISAGRALEAAFEVEVIQRHSPSRSACCPEHARTLRLGSTLRLRLRLSARFGYASALSARLQPEGCQHVSTLRAFGSRSQPIGLRHHPSAHEEPVRMEAVPSLPPRSQTTS